MGTFLAFALKPLVVLAFGYAIGKPVVNAVGKLRDGKLKRLLLRRISED
jgi:hypothetical protein